ncbi:MAG: deoxynucleoside kinase [Ruminococcus sp.]|nr:deoxynucleoside kinase [Ruminococcus sp.]
MKSKIIVIEGLDGSGKATQTKILADKLAQKGLKVRKLEFPDYDNPSSSLVKMYLNGDFGDKPEDVNAYASSAFYAVDRVASYLQFWKKDYEDGTVILSDRYATSNIIYQMSKLDSSEYDGFIEWQNDFEYEKLGIPKPDAVIYLDVEPEVSQKLMEKRYGGDMSKMDLHEKNVKFLLDCRESALFAAEKCGWKVINCCENGDIKSIDRIAEEIEKVTADILC